MNPHRVTRQLAIFGILILCLSTAEAAEPLPGGGLLPKQETGALRFLKEHAQYDGRGVVVAIFDTGVDPGAAGLQTTTDGKVKIIDMVDGSGSGDVDTATVRGVKDHKITGLSGKTLTIPDQWKNPSGKYHLGIKRAFEIYPGGLVSRLKKKRRKAWDIKQRGAVDRLKQQLSRFKAAHPKPSDADKKRIAELQTRLKLLGELQKEYDDPGPIFDCVVFHDGEHWQAAIDTDEDGKLSDEKVMANYRLAQQYATFGSQDLLNFAVNIYNQGQLLSIVTDVGAHGTHVAGIVAAHFPKHPEFNGVAPGAQIVSVKIGDSRVGSSSMGTGETRGLIAVLQNKCDLINMSYGGPSADPNRGRIAALYSEIVNKHGVIWVASAGNSGPALSTVGAPGGTTSALIGVGAYVSPAMMKAMYSLRENLGEMPYTWSSRGPTYDGDLGVNISAPGGAIAPVPTWTLRRNMLMNGTSMSSPNACGNIALLLSGLKDTKTAYSPNSVKRALENTARPINDSDVFAHGRGLIQTDAAYDYLIENAKANGERLRFTVDLPDRHGARGLYLRQPLETEKITETLIRVRPIFREDANNKNRVKFQMRLTIKCSADWVDVPQELLLMYGGRTFGVEVDPRNLPHGISTAEVVGYDAADPGRGPIMRLPITVIRPEPIESGRSRPRWSEKMHFVPGHLERRFIAVPPGVTWADLRLRTGDMDGPRRFVVHTLQVLPRVSFDKSSLRRFTTLRPQSEEVSSIAVTGGRTLELCLGQYWSSLGESDLEAELTFHSIVPDDAQIQLQGGRLTEKIAISTPLHREHVAPAATLKKLRKSIAPAKATLELLPGERDRLPGNRQFSELVLSYDFKLDAPASVTPQLALALEDDPWRRFDSQLWMIFDSARRLVSSGGDPKEVKLGKGSYVLRYQVRSDRPSDLEKLKQMPLLLDRSLAKPLAVGVYAHPDDAIDGSSKFSGATLDRGSRAVFYLTGPPATDLPKGARPGDLLLGNITYGKKAGKTAGEGQRPGGYPISYVVTTDLSKPSLPAASNDTDKDADTQDDGEKKKPTLEEQLRDTKIARLATLRQANDRKAFAALAKTLLERAPDDLRVLVEQLEMADAEKDRKRRLPEIVVAADAVIAQIDTAKLAAHYGVKLDPEDKLSAKVRKEMDKQKATLTDALYRKGRAIAFMDLPKKYLKPEDRALEVPKHPENKGERNKLFNETFAELAKWVDTSDSKFVLLSVRRQRRNKNPGAALRLLRAHIAASPPSVKLDKKLGDLYDELGWRHWRDYQKKWMILRHPVAYPLF